ncbi:MAG: hypothetical protein KDD62_06370, partial [Bdellovibrionales bacterium]|nr:hypothetical protein [Bdellovibrionales bacterium]
LPLDIIREKTEFDKHIIFYRQNSPLVKEIFASLMQYVFDTEGVCISKESDGAEIKDHLRFDRLCSFVQGELLSIMNQKGFESHDQ